MAARIAFCVGCALLTGPLLSCGGFPSLREELKDPSRTLRVIVRSVPSGAEVYGIKRGKSGTLLGATPLICSYMVIRSGHSPEIISDVPVDETIVSDFDLLRTEETRSYHTFQCVIALDGHQTAVIQRKLVDEKWYNWREVNTSDVFKGGRTVDIMVTLPPLPADSRDAGE